MSTPVTNLEINRGDSSQIAGLIAPGAGGSLSVPAAGLVFQAYGQGGVGVILKSLGSGVAITSSSSSSIAYTVTIDPADTLTMPNKPVSMNWNLVLTENNGTVSTVARGVLLIDPRAA